MSITPTSPVAMRSMTDLMQREIEREAKRTGVAYDAIQDKISLGGPSPGVLAFRTPYDSWKKVSFPIGMSLLAAIPNHAGSGPVRKALEGAWHAGTASPFPRNDPATLQVGDRFGSGKVCDIRVGQSYDNAKNGESCKAVPRTAFAEAYSAERIIVIVEGKDGAEGWWRRGTQVRSQMQRPAPAGREDLRRLRRDRVLLARVRDAELRLLFDGKGSPEKLLAYDAMLTANLRMLETSGKPPCDPLRDEQLLLRHRVRDAKRLKERLLVPPPTFHRGIDAAASLARNEIDLCETRLKAIGKQVKAEARERARSAAPGM